MSHGPSPTPLDQGAAGQKAGPLRRAAERVVVLALATVLALSVVVPATLSGRPAMWALPELELLNLSATARALALAAVIVLGLYLFHETHRHGRRTRLRAGAAIGGMAAMAMVFFALGPITYVGDWDWLLWIAERRRVVGKWYGASLLYGTFHHALASVTAATPEQSVRLCSSLCGALCAYAYARTVGALGLPQVLRAWPFLYASAFGVIAVGLGHVEVYAAVALAMALVLWSGVILVQEPTLPRALVFSFLTAIAVTTHIAGLLLFPAWLVALGLVGWRGYKRESRVLVAAAVVGLMLVPAVLLAVDRLGPAVGRQSLLAYWAEQFAWRRFATVRGVPYFHPADVTWPALPDFIHPRYWFAAWHLRDLALSAFLDDRLGFALAGTLLVFGVARWLSRRPHPFSPVLVFVLVAATPWVGYALAVLNYRPFPWDFDLYSYVALATNITAAGLLAQFARGVAYGWLPNLLVVGVAIASQLSGNLLLEAAGRAPQAAGPASHGLRLAATPARIDVSQDTGVQVFFWLYNDTDKPIYIRPVEIGYVLRGTSEAERLADTPRRRAVLAGRRVPPRGFSCLADVPLAPGGAGRSALRSEAGPIRRRSAPMLGPPGLYEAEWEVWLRRGRDRRETYMQSNPVEVIIPPARGAIDG